MRQSQNQYQRRLMQALESQARVRASTSRPLFIVALGLDLTARALERGGSSLLIGVVELRPRLTSRCFSQNPQPARAGKCSGDAFRRAVCPWDEIRQYAQTRQMG